MWKKSCVSVLSSVHHGDDEFRPSKLSLELLADLRDTGRIDLTKWNPDLCIRMIQAAVQLDCYMAMKKLILRASREWMKDFLGQNGFGILLESLAKLETRTCSVVTASAQVQCAGCLHALVNSGDGLQHLIENREDTRRLVQLLGSNCCTVKLQVVELLCALCLYSSDGYELTLDALNFYKDQHQTDYRFDVIIEELKSASTYSYQTTLVALCNCLIISNTDIVQRCLIRDELVHGGMGDIMTKLEQDTLEDEELRIQTGVFEKWRIDDEEDHVPQSDVQLFNKLRQKILGTPNHVYLRKILITLNNLSYETGKTRETNLTWNSLLEVINNQACANTPLLSRVQKSKIANSKKIMKNCFCFNKFRKKRFSNVGVNTENVETKTCETMTSASVPTKVKSSPSKEYSRTTGARSRVPKSTTLSPPTTPSRRLTSINSPPKSPKSTTTNPSPVNINRSPLKSKRLENLSTPAKPFKEIQSLSPVKRTPVPVTSSVSSMPLKKISSLSPPALKSTLHSFSSPPRSIVTSTPKLSQSSANKYRIFPNQTPSVSVNSTKYIIPLSPPSIQKSQPDENITLNSSLPSVSCCCNCHENTRTQDSETFSMLNLSNSSSSIPTSSCQMSDFSLRLPPICSTTSQLSVPSRSSSIPPPPPMPSSSLLTLTALASSPISTGDAILLLPPIPSRVPTSSSPPSNESIPPPPPLPCSSLIIPSPPPLPARGIIPPPPPLPSGSSIPPPPPPPLPFSNCTPPPPPMPNYMPPPPPMPHLGSIPLPPPGGPPPPPMPLSNVPNSNIPPPPSFAPLLSYSNQNSSVLSSDNSHPHYLTDSKNWSLPTRRFVHEEKFNSLRQRKKMKTIGWTKIPPVKLNNNSIWAQVVNVRDIDFDFDQMEELFCQKQAQIKKPASPNTSDTAKSSPVKSVSLLDSKRSLTINIFLRQFKNGIPEVIGKVENAQNMNVDSLRGLLKILPDSDEVKLIKNYKGDVASLDDAERFFQRLISIPEYRYQIEAMLQQVEGPLLIDELTPQIERIKSVCEVLMNDKNLVEFLGVILKLGNLVNSGTYAANAVGFKVSDLSKLTDMRANKPQMTFLHYVILVAKSNNAHILDFTANAPLVKEALKVSLSSVEDDINQMVKTSTRVSKELSSKSDAVKQMFSAAIKEHSKNLDMLKADFNQMKTATHNLITHFCEDPKTFQLEELLQIFNHFFDGTLRADKENEVRRQREEKLVKLEMNKENLKVGNIMKIPKKRGKIPDAMIGGYNQEKGLVDLLMDDIRNGDFRLKTHQSTANGLMVEQNS